MISLMEGNMTLVLDVQKANKKMFLSKVLSLVIFLVFFVTAFNVSYSFPQGGKVEATITLANAKRDVPSNVVVWLEPLGTPARVPKQTPPYPTMRQKGKKFIPQVLVVPAGYTVSFPNDDPFPHNVFSPSDVKRFDLGLYQAGESRDLPMNRPGVVPIYCNIHPQMRAFILAVKTRYYGVSDSSGKVEIGNVPNGKYSLKVWHERSLTSTLNKLTREVTVSGSTNAGSIQVDEAGYTNIPHKNKDGRDYAPGF